LAGRIDHATARARTNQRLSGGASTMNSPVADPGPSVLASLTGYGVASHGRPPTPRSAHRDGHLGERAVDRHSAPPAALARRARVRRSEKR
jgi:hypothetical protein